MIVEKLFVSAKSTSVRDEGISEKEDSSWGFLKSIFNSGERKEIRQDNADIFDDIYACINILSDDIAKLPLKVYQKHDGAIKRIEKKDHTIAKLLSTKPNDFMNSSDWKKLIMVDVLITGNHFSYVVRNANGKVTSIMPLPNSTQIMVLENGSLRYQTTINKQIVQLPPWDVIHIKGFTRDGIKGKSPIRVIAERVESNESANNYNKSLLEQGGAPKGILRVPGSLNKEAKRVVKEEWKKVNGQDAIGVIDSGLEYQQLGISNQDMQFIDSQKFNTQKIAAIYKVPLHKLNEMGRATYANVEQQALEYVKNTLQPWITKIEEELDSKLFNDFEQDENFYVKFNLDSELRGDSETRAKVDKIKIESGSSTLNEVRGRNEDSPYDSEWGDRPLMTLNYTFLDNLLRLQNSKAKVTSDGEIKYEENKDD